MRLRLGILERVDQFDVVEHIPGGSGQLSQQRVFESWEQALVSAGLDYEELSLLLEVGALGADHHAQKLVF